MTFASLYTRAEASMAVRSVRVARAYRDLCRACRSTFGQDVATQMQMRHETARALRQQVEAMSEDDMVKDLKSGTDFVRYEIVQASYNTDSERYKVHITQDHISKQKVIDLQPPLDPSSPKTPKRSS